MSLPFSIDKEKGLEIMQTIFDQLKEEHEVSINENMKINKIYSEDDFPNLIDFKHKVAIIELDFDNTKNFEETIKNDDNYEKSTDIEIRNGSYIEDDKIYLDGYLHNTQLECDYSFSVFHYNEQYKCFITEKEDGWNYFIILDLSAYN